MFSFVQPDGLHMLLLFTYPVLGAFYVVLALLKGRKLKLEIKKSNIIAIVIAPLLSGAIFISVLFIVKKLVDVNTYNLEYGWMVLICSFFASIAISAFIIANYLTWK